MDNETQANPTASGVGSTDGLGRWFFAEYGYRLVRGQCVGRSKYGDYVLRFRWGGPFRTLQTVEATRILCETEDPRWISKLWRLINRPNVPDQRSDESPKTL